MYFAQLRLADSLKALWIILVLAALSFGILAVASPQVTQAAAPKLTIQFTCAQAVDNQSGQVCVHTQPRAALTITITYCSGYKAVSSSLQGTVYADTSGNYTWTWTPQTTCRGAATARVTATLSGHKATKTDKFTVQ